MKTYFSILNFAVFITLSIFLFSCNSQDKTKAITVNVEKENPKGEKERKEHFLNICQEVADKLGHSRNMLRNSYLLPNLEPNYIKYGKIINIPS